MVVLLPASLCLLTFLLNDCARNVDIFIYCFDPSLILFICHFFHLKCLLPPHFYYPSIKACPFFSHKMVSSCVLQESFQRMSPLIFKSNISQEDTEFLWWQRDLSSFFTSRLCCVLEGEENKNWWGVEMFESHEGLLAEKIASSKAFLMTWCFVNIKHLLSKPAIN